MPCNNCDFIFICTTYIGSQFYANLGSFIFVFCLTKVICQKKRNDTNAQIFYTVVFLHTYQ